MNKSDRQELCSIKTQIQELVDKLRAWAEYRCNLGNVSFKDYLKEVRRSIQTRKRDVTVPYGSNKKSDWNGFFRTVRTYIE